MDEKNKLYFGDNLKILREYVEDTNVDLIYLDPPFNSSATYSFGVAPPFRAAHAGLKPGATAAGEESAAEIMASEDFAVAPLYERRARRSQTGATVGPGVGGGVQGNRHPRPAQARRLDPGAARLPGPQRYNGLPLGDEVVICLVVRCQPRLLTTC